MFGSTSEPTVPFPREEPASVYREGAQALRQYYVALVQAGFSESEALQLLSVAVAASLSGGSSSQ
jgi:hypothetical protein